MKWRIDMRASAFSHQAIHGLLKKALPAVLMFLAGAQTCLAQTSPRMSISMLRQFETDLIGQYQRCWSAVGTSNTTFVPMIVVHYAPNGALMDQPMLYKPVLNPEDHVLAEAALRTVRMCDPIRIVDEYKPYYNDWKNYVLRFNVNEMAH